MRIGYVLKRYPRYSETFIVAELLAHQAAGIEVEIFALKNPNEVHPQPAVARVTFPVHYLVDDLGRDDREGRQAIQLAELVRARGIGLLHAHFATSATAVARTAAQLTGVPYTFTAHAKDIYHLSVDQAELRARVSDAARVVTVSEFNRAHLTALGSVGADHVVRIYNGIDLAEYRPAVGGSRSDRILAVGRLVEKKGFADLLTALARLADAGTPVACDLVGSGPLESDLLRQRAALGLEGLVHFHGALPRERVAQLMREAMAFVAPCVVSADGDRDGMPTVLLEAMALGAPCIATDVTGIPELIESGRTGVLVPERDPAALARAIVAVRRFPESARTMAGAARKLIEQQFDLSINVARLRSVFADACAQPSAYPEVP